MAQNPDKWGISTQYEAPVVLLKKWVDFHYNGQTVIIEGGTQILLSTLIEQLNIVDLYGDPFDMSQVAGVSFTDEHLILVEQVSGDVEVNGEIVNVGDKDFLLTSQEAFDTFEDLEIHLSNGDIIHLGVTDASEVSASDGIKSLLTDVSITGAKQEDGNYVFYPDQPYGIHLTFKEVNKAEGQFPMDQSFTYQLPAGFIPDGASASGSLPITLSGGDQAGKTVNLNYTISSSGLITFTWDQTTDPAAYQQLADALYTQFKLDIECTYSGSDGKVVFGNDIEKGVVVKNNGKVNVNKNGKYNAATNCVDYTVTVYSDGITKDVVITDTVSGSALTYKNDAVSSTNVYGKEVPSPTSTSNGFTLTIPQMADQETVTVKYSAAVDLSKVTKDENGNWGTFDETGNKVVVKSKDNPDVEKENSGKDFENKISMSNIGKTGTPVEADESGHATVTWTINANDNANVSMGGHTISDSIDGNSVPMTYNGSGIHVVAYNPDGSLNYEKDIAWGADGLTKAADGKSWVWNIPNSWPDNQKLSYKITYTTDADVSDRFVKTQVKNTADSDNGGHVDKGVDVTPNGGGLTARKKVVKTDLTANTITWEVSFDVPETGLDSAKIVDTVPLYYNTSGRLTAVDNYIDGTVTVTPELEGNEDFEVSTTTDADGKEYITIEFFKTVDEQKVPGLTGTGSKRKIRVQFQTEIDSAWVQAAKDNPYESNALNHTNNANVILNGQTIGTSASTRVDGNEPGMSKVHGEQTEYQINGNKLPAFPFTVTLTGISDDSFDQNGNLVIEDTFSAKYLAFYPESQDGRGDNPYVGHVFAKNDYTTAPVWNHDAESENSVVSSPAEGKLLITLNRDTIPKRADGSYYPYYYIFYYLTVKDPIALEKLQKAIQTSESGVYTLLNTVTNEEFGTVTDEFSFDIPVVDKSIIKPEGKSGKLNDLVYYENGNYMVDYKIDVNPDALQLGDEEELTLTDDYENLAVDYTTIKIQKYVNGTLVDTTSADGVSWNRKGNRVTYTLQNGVHYVITYSARITGEPRQDGNVTYSNTAEFFGVKDWEKHDQNITTGDEGSSPTYGITVFKHAKGAGSTPLPGAVFKLYRYGEQGTPDSWKDRPEATTDLDQEDWNYVEDLTTGADGSIKTTGSLAVNTWYKLVETTAPMVDGQAYQKKDFAYVFWITDGGAADYGNYVYLNDDVVAIDNEPVLPETVDVGVTKTWTGDNGDASKRKSITVRLYADGVPYDLAKDANGNPLPARDDTVKVLPLKGDGTTDGYEWTGLPSGPVYSVVEDGVAGYTTTYNPKSTQVGGTINIKNKYIPGKTYIHVEKNWSDKITDDAKPEDITVQLKRKVSANGTIQFVRYDGLYLYSTTVPVGSTVTITYKEKNTNNVRGYTVYKGLDTSGDVLKGTVKTSWGTGDGTVTIQDIDVGADGVTIKFPNDGFSWDNLEAMPTVTITGGSSGGTYTEDTNFNNENRYYTLSADNGWKLDIDRLVKQDDDGEYVYYIEEVGVNDNTQTPEEAGYVVTYENNNGIAGGTGNAANDTITVTNAPETVDVDFHKTWVNTVNQGQDKLVNNTGRLRVVVQLERWYLDANGVEKKDADVSEATLYGDKTTYLNSAHPENFKETTANGNWSAQFTELPKKGIVNGQTVEYIYKISEKQVYLASSVDSAHNNLLKLGIFNSSTESDGNSTTVTNTFPTTNIDVEKKWKNEDGTPATPPSGVTVTVQLQRRWRDISRNYDYSGTLYPGEWSEYADVDGETLTLSGDSWTKAFSNLPLYGWRSEESTENKLSYVQYEYQVVETGVTLNGVPTDKYYTTEVATENVGATDKKTTITNTEAEGPKTGSLKITKEIADGSNAQTTETFTFEVVFTKDSAPLTDTVQVVDSTRTTATDATPDDNGKLTVTVTGAGTATITGIPAGTTYVVTEPTDYLPAGWSQVGEVEYGDSNKIIAANDEDKATITNKYEATGEAELSAKKAANTKLGSKTFQFVLTDEAGEVIETSRGVTQGATATFTAIRYTLDDVGDHVYKIHEVIPEDATNENGDSYAASLTDSSITGPWTKDGVTYDSSEKSVTVNVADNGNGELTITYDGESELTVPEFVNVYSSSTEITFKANKVFLGTTSTEFTFKLTQAADANGTPLTEEIDDPENSGQTITRAVEGETRTVTGTGKVTFTTITYDQDDAGNTFYYVIEEVAPGQLDANNVYDDGSTKIMYDTSKQIIKVVVEDDGAGKLTATPTYAVEKKGDYDATFTNTEVTDITGTKVWQGPDGEADAPKDVVLVLTLKQYTYANSNYTNETVMGTVTITADANGNVSAETEGQAASKVTDWSYTWRNLPLTDGTNTYRYTVTETLKTTGTTTYHRKEGEMTAYLPDNETTVQTITNVENSAYELPSTGGAGTTIFYGAGASLMLLAILGFVLLARKRSAGDGI